MVAPTIGDFFCPNATNHYTPHNLLHIESKQFKHYFVPLNKEDNHPIFVYLGAIPFVAIFSTKEKLQQLIKLLNIENYIVYQIQVPENFIENILSSGVDIIIDPHITPDGKTQYTLITKPS